MFQELNNQVYTPSSDTVTITDNTDIHVDGSSKRILFGLGSKDETVTLSFDEVTLSQFEELVFHYYTKRELSRTYVFKITICGEEYIFKNSDIGDMTFVIVDTSKLSSTSSITITCLVDSLMLFIDCIGVRSALYDTIDIDLITALQKHIQLDYGVSTTLKDDLESNREAISLNDNPNIFNTTVLEIESDTVTEQVELYEEGCLKAPVVNSFAAGSTVRALCPTLREDWDDIEPDPVCGIVITDLATSQDDVVVETATGQSIKRFLGSLGLLVYIDCTSKKAVFSLARQYQHKYGERFSFLLDGERIEIYLEDEGFLDDEIGNLPRKTWQYRVETQPIKLFTGTRLTDINFEMELKSP